MSGVPRANGAPVAQRRTSPEASKWRQVVFVAWQCHDAAAARVGGGGGAGVDGVGHDEGPAKPPHASGPRGSRLYRCSDSGKLALSGISRQNANQCLKKLEKQGLLRLEYGGVTVIDLERLRNYGE
jgi:hypothetical protein